MSSDPRSTARRRHARLLATLALIAAGLVALVARPAFGATFNRSDVLTDDVFRTSASMSQTQTQAFLDTMPGILKTYRCPDHTGVRKWASQIVWEAAQAWDISPMVILSMLQKEEGLLTMTDPPAERLTKAMGCGIFPGSTNTYPGFGNQVWHGSRKLSSYEDTYHWKAGTSLKIDGVVIVPANAATFSMYTYNPSFSGNGVFSDVYWRYFGDPHGPVRFRPVYRFVSRVNATYRFTATQSERIAIQTTQSGTWRYAGVTFSIDTSSAANTSPLYRLYNPATGKYFYTVSVGEMNRVIRSSGRHYRLDRIVCLVSTKAGSGPPVYRLSNRKTGASVLVASAAEKASLIRSSGFRMDCVLFYMGG